MEYGRKLAEIHGMDPTNLPLAVEEIKRFAEYLTPEAEEVYRSFLPAVAHSFPQKRGGWITVHCRYLGLTISDGGRGEEFPSPGDFQKIADIFNRAVDEGLVGWGCLCPAMFLPLATIDRDKRGLLLVYAFSDLDHDELNDRLGINNFVKEGALPPEPQ